MVLPSGVMAQQRRGAWISRVVSGAPCGGPTPSLEAVDGQGAVGVRRVGTGEGQKLAELLPEGVDDPEVDGLWGSRRGGHGQHDARPGEVLGDMVVAAMVACLAGEASFVAHRYHERPRRGQGRPGPRRHEQRRAEAAAPGSRRCPARGAVGRRRHRRLSNAG
jgi:hypothetical protein